MNKLLVQLLKSWARGIGAKKLRKMATHPNPDFQFKAPLIGEYDIFVTEPDTSKPHPRARKATAVTVQGERFWVWAVRVK